MFFKLKLSLTWYMTFFNDFHWFSMTFPGKMPFFQVNTKFHDFSSQQLISMIFPGLCEQVRSDSTENKLNPIHFLIYYNVQFA